MKRLPQPDNREYEFYVGGLHVVEENGPDEWLEADVLNFYFATPPQWELRAGLGNILSWWHMKGWSEYVEEMRKR